MNLLPALGPSLRPSLGLAINRGALPVSAWARALPALRSFVTANYNQPNPHNQAVMTSPPTVTTSSSDLFNNYPGKVLAVASGALSPSIRMEGGSYEIYATNFARGKTATLASGSNLYGFTRFSVNANSSSVAFYVAGSTYPYRFLVNDRYVDVVGTIPATTTGTSLNYIILDFGSSALRKVTIEMQSPVGVATQAFRFVGLPAGGTFVAWPASTAKGCVVFGDSITMGYSATAFGDGFATVVGDMLGFSNTVPSGVGGTGYVNTNGGTRFTLPQRIAADLDNAIAATSVDVVVVAMGVNDISTPSGVESAANASFDLIRSKCPAAQVVVVGPWDANAPSAPAAGYSTVKAAIQSAVGARSGFTFIDPQGVAYTQADYPHPDTAGHKTLGLWLAAQIKTALGA